MIRQIASNYHEISAAGDFFDSEGFLSALPPKWGVFFWKFYVLPPPPPKWGSKKSGKFWSSALKFYRFFTLFWTTCWAFPAWNLKKNRSAAGSISKFPEFLTISLLARRGGGVILTLRYTEEFIRMGRVGELVGDWVGGALGMLVGLSVGIKEISIKLIHRR